MNYKTEYASSLPKTLMILATASLCSLAISPKAEALTPLGSYTSSFSDQVLELNGTPVLTLPKYNGLYTLEQVVFTVNATLTNSGSVRNIGGIPQTFTVRTSNDYDLYASSGSPTALLNLFNPNTGGTFSPFNDSGISITGTQSYISVPPIAIRPFGPFTVNGASNATFTNATDVAGFVGSGNYSFTPYTSSVVLITGGGGTVATNISASLSSSIKVEYFGTAAQPVPFGFSTNASLLVFGGAFYGINKLRKNMAVKKSQV